MATESSGFRRLRTCLPVIGATRYKIFWCQRRSVKEGVQEEKPTKEDSERKEKLTGRTCEERRYKKKKSQKVEPAKKQLDCVVQSSMGTVEWWIDKNNLMYWSMVASRWFIICKRSVDGSLDWMLQQIIVCCQRGRTEWINIKSNWFMNKFE